MNSKRIAILLVVPALIVSAAAVYAAQKFSNSGAKAVLGEVKEESAGSPGEIAPKAGAISVIPVKVSPQESVIRLTGTLAGDEKSEVATNTSGIVQEVFVERGSMVEKGDVMVQIDPTDAKNMLAEGMAAVDEIKAVLVLDDDSKPFKIDQQASVRAAKAALDLAETNYKRYSGLIEQKAISKAVYDQAATEFESAQQRYQLAVNQARQLYQSYKRAQVRVTALKKALKDTSITAPFAGMVAEKYVNPGERVSAGPGGGAKILSLVKIDPLRLLLTIPQQHAGAVKKGQKVKFAVDAFPDRSFEAAVKYIGPNIENLSRSLIVEAVVPNTDKTLRPGFFATAELATATQEDRFFVPKTAIILNGDAAHLFIVRDGVARDQLVSLGQSTDGDIEVLTGVIATDRVIAAPVNVRDGDKVG